MKKKKEDNFLFNFIAPIYGLFYNSQKKHYAININKMRNTLDVSKYNNIIDVGCGTGALCSVLNKEGLSVTGVDPAKKMLNIGAKKTENKDIKFTQACTCTKLPFEDKSYDLSIASYVAHGIKYDERVLLYEEMSRITKKYVVIYDYNENRGFFTDIIEYLEGGDYFNFIKNVKTELNKYFKTVQIVDVDKRASWYICQPK